MNVDYHSTDWGTVVQRTTSRAPVEKGGWSAYTNFVFGISMVNPAANNYIRGNGLQAMTGWPDAPRADELLLALVMTTGSRIHARVGGLKASEIKGQDGLR